jgi:hypothetical protein
VDEPHGCRVLHKMHSTESITSKTDGLTHPSVLIPIWLAVGPPLLLLLPAARDVKVPLDASNCPTAPVHSHATPVAACTRQACSHAPCMQLTRCSPASQLLWPTVCPWNKHTPGN